MRTDPTAPKHLGISFILFDMKTPGVSTKPILLISGMSPFCETFFDDVRVPKANVVGELNKGWEVAKYLLTHEREMISAIGLGAGPKGAAPADQDGMDLGDQVIVYHGVQLAGARGGAPDIDAAHRARGAEDHGAAGDVFKVTGVSYLESGNLGNHRGDAGLAAAGGCICTRPFWKVSR